MAYKRHAEQIERVKEKAAAVIKHSKTVAERTINKYNEVLNQNNDDEEEDQNFDDYINFELPIVSMNKNIRKQNKLFKKEFIKISQNLEKDNFEKEKSSEMKMTTTTTTNELYLKLNEISNHFHTYYTQNFPKIMLKQLNTDINILYNYSEKYQKDIIESNVLLSILDTCLKTVDTKWLFPLKLIVKGLSLIEKKYINSELLKKILTSENSLFFNIISIQSRVLLLLETTEESDDKPKDMIDLIKISTLLFKIILSILDYSQEKKELHEIIVKYLLNTTVFKPINIKFIIKELYSQDSPLNDFYYFASKLYFKASFIQNSWEKPIYEKYNMKENEVAYFTDINGEIINGNI